MESLEDIIVRPVNFQLAQLGFTLKLHRTFNKHCLGLLRIKFVLYLFARLISWQVYVGQVSPQGCLGPAVV